MTTQTLAHPKSKTSIIKKTALIAIIVNGLLGVLKTIGGFLFNSHALIADGLHSLSDLIIDFMVIIGGHWSLQEADEEHPYGHQRIETAMTLFISIFLIFTGVIIGYDAFRSMLHPVFHPTHSYALILAVFSALANEGLFRYTLKMNHHIDTDLLKACAWHHRSDALTSIVVVIGILASVLGFRRLDNIAAIFVGVIIIKMGWDYTWESIQQLIDRGVELDTNDAITHAIQKTPGVEKIHQLRTRLMGQDIYVDVHVLVDPYISVSAGHYIAQDVHRKLMQKFPKIKDVTVHIDSEDDEAECPCLNLPNIEEIGNKLIKKWRKQHPEIIDWNVHFINKEIQLDLIIDPKKVNWDTLSPNLKEEAIEFHSSIKSIRILSENSTIVILAQN
jgi:cation diffusion facilitator family transporter